MENSEGKCAVGKCVNSPECDKSHETCHVERDVADLEERRIRHWVIRWIVMFASFIISLIVISVLYTFLFQERDLETTVTTSVIDNMFMVLKFMFE